MKHFGDSRSCGIIRCGIKLCKKGGRQKAFLLHRTAEMATGTAGCDTNVQYVMHVVTEKNQKEARSLKPGEKSMAKDEAAT